MFEELSRNTGLCVLFWIVTLHPPYEPFLALLFFKVHICQNLYPAMIKPQASKQISNFQWYCSLEIPMTPSKMCAFGRRTNKSQRKTFYESMSCYVFWGWSYILAIAGVMAGWLLKYHLATIYPLLFSRVCTVMLFDLSLPCVASSLISLLHLPQVCIWEIGILYCSKM